MIADRIAIPKFATEAEEADRLYEHREEHSEVMAKAMRESRTISAPESWAERGLKREKIPVYLDAEDVDLARRQAAALGIDTESYLQSLVHKALTNAS
jgi:hypothetical protein